MARRNPLGMALLLVLFVVVGYYTLWSQPGMAKIVEAFPVGLMAGSFLVIPRRRWRPLLFVVFWVLSTGLYLSVGRELVVAVGWALAASVGSLVVAEGVTARDRRRAALLSEDDLKYFCGASLAGALVAGAICAGFGVAAGMDRWWVVYVAVALPQLGSYLVLMPHFMGRPRFPGVALLPERVLQWVLTVAASLLAFSPLELGPGVMFVLIPFLGWSALRAPMRETIVQLLVVAVIAHSMTVEGLGPFAADAGTGAVRTEMLGVLLALFICACALTCIPFAIAVGAQRRESWQARREQAKVEQLVHSVEGIAIIGTDQLGNIDLFNPGACAVLGYAPEDVMGRPQSMFHSRSEIERLANRLGTDPDYRALARELAQPANAGMDVEFIRRDGDVRTLQLSISRVVDAQGRITGYVSTGEDVTQRVQQQRALEEALSAERTALENLREVDAVKDAFVSGVSHELRTPITSILGYLEMLEEGGFGPLQHSQSNALGRVKGNSRRLLSLIDDLLTLSRIQDGSLAVATCQLDLRDVARSAHEEMSPAMLAAGIDFTLDLPDEEVLVVGDEERLGRVLVNLLGNAIKFTDRLGKVDLTLALEDGCGVVSVRDTGIGIPPGEQGKLFDRFFRSSVAHERAIQGSGLGLSIARAIVETHGGVIEVESGAGVGSTFRVRLPLEGEAPVAVQQLAADAQAEGRALAAYGGAGSDVLAS